MAQYNVPKWPAMAEPLFPSAVAIGLFISNPSGCDIRLSSDPEALNASASQSSTGTPTVGTLVPKNTSTPFQFSRYKGTLWVLADEAGTGDAYLEVESYGI